MVGPLRPVRPTMKDVADRVGLSIKSVSRVLNGDAGVSQARAEQVLTVANDLGFRRNDLARGLRLLARTGTIGVAVMRPSTRFFEGLIRGINQVATQHGALVLTATTHSAEREQAALMALSSRRVDGLIIAPSGADQAYLLADQAADLPLVFVDSPANGLIADAVVADNRGGGYAATRHLLSRGHRRIGVIGTHADRFTITERLAGFASAIKEDPMPAAGLIRLNCNGAAGAQLAAEELLDLDDPPTAFFALNNLCTIGTVRALRNRSLHRTVALVGFDDFETADLLDPPLTIIAQDFEEMGRSATNQLFDRLNGTTVEPHRTTLPVHLVVRGSGEIDFTN